MQATIAGLSILRAFASGSLRAGPRRAVAGTGEEPCATATREPNAPRGLVPRLPRGGAGCSVVDAAEPFRTLRASQHAHGLRLAVEEGSPWPSDLTGPITGDRSADPSLAGRRADGRSRAAPAPAPQILADIGLCARDDDRPCNASPGPSQRGTYNSVCISVSEHGATKRRSQRVNPASAAPYKSLDIGVRRSRAARHRGRSAARQPSPQSATSSGSAMPARAVLPRDGCSARRPSARRRVVAIALRRAIRSELSY